MNCTSCRSHLSEYLENAVTPLLERDMRAHFEECRRCTRDLRELEVALARLRAAASVPAPPDLATQVTRRLLAVSPGGIRPETGERLVASPSREGNRTWRWASAAAAGLLIAAVGFLAGRISGHPGAETLAELEDARREVRSLEIELRDTRTELSGENTTLGRELASLKSGLELWKATTLAEHRSALEAERDAQRALEGRLQEAARRIEAQAGALASLETRLARAIEQNEGAIEERDALAAKLRAARAELARAERTDVERMDIVPQRRAEPSRGRPGAPSTGREAPNEAHPPHDPQPITFVRDGEVLRMQLRGPVDELVPHLLALAEDERQPEIADLALVTLESHFEPLDRGEADEAVGSPSEQEGFGGWLRRGVAAVRLATFAESEEPDVQVPDRRARIDRVRRIWEYTQSL